MKRALTLFLALVLLTAAAAAPASAAEPTYKEWSQMDPRWAGMSICADGSAGHTMKGSGCYVTAVAKLLVHAGQQDPAAFDPQVCLNALLQHRLLGSQGDMATSHFNAENGFLQTYAPELTYVHSDDHGAWNKETAVGKIGNWIRDGYYVIVCVIGASGNTHWMLVDHVTEDNVYVADNGGVFAVYGSGRYLTGVRDQALFRYSGKLAYPAYDHRPVSDEITVLVDGSAVAWTDVRPFIDSNNRTMVPLRAVADAMGLAVGWDGAARVASFSGTGMDDYGNAYPKKLSFPVDSETAIGESEIFDPSAGEMKACRWEVPMDTAAVIVHDRTYAPIRYLAEFFGYNVGWDEKTRTVRIEPQLLSAPYDSLTDENMVFLRHDAATGYENVASIAVESVYADGTATTATYVNAGNPHGCVYEYRVDLPAGYRATQSVQVTLRITLHSGASVTRSWTYVLRQY